MSITIIGTGSYLPEKVITNNELSLLVDTNDEWIVQRTGIKERRISEGLNTSDLAERAARRALESAKISGEDIDLIIVGTCTPDNYCPSVACILQKRLNAKKAICFDLSAACSGFIFSMATAKAMMNNYGFSKALVIGAENLSKVTDWKDRSTCVLFGDGSGAVVLSQSVHKEGIENVILGNDGFLGDAIKIEAIKPLKTFDIKENHINIDEIQSESKIHMEGSEVFKFATAAIENVIKKLLDDSGYCMDDIKYIIPHQANVRIIDYACKKLKVDKDKFYINIQKYANTSSASIPIALDEMNRHGMLKNGDKIILMGFGGGLSFGGTLITWNV